MAAPPPENLKFTPFFKKTHSTSILFSGSVFNFKTFKNPAYKPRSKGEDSTYLCWNGDVLDRNLLVWFDLDLSVAPLARIRCC